MKIYILRHEERTIDASFFSPLTKNGLKNSINLIHIIEKLNITTIISSPFIRTLQTILPYSKYRNIKINLEYGLCEILHSNIIPPKSYNVELPDYLCEEFNYNPEYNSLIKSTELEYPEDEKMFENRTKKILKFIIQKYYKTNENILLVTHQGHCKNILQIINKNVSIKPETESIDNYSTGKISLIFDQNKWKYAKLN
jgi:broad specificity phosphatase PhoE